MYARTLIFTIFAALLSVVAAHETNAERMARGMSPLAPRRLFNPAHVARTVPSAVSCPSNAISGYIALRGSASGSLLGYLSNDGTSCSKTSSPQKFEYPSGCDSSTSIKLYGSNNYLGVYARSIVGSIVSSIGDLLASLKARTNSNSCSFTSTKVIGSVLGGKTNVGGDTCQTQVFNVASKDHCITQQWKDNGKTSNLVPIGCYSKNKASISVQWVDSSTTITASVMAAVCPGGIEVDVILRFECGL